MNFDTATWFAPEEIRAIIKGQYSTHLCVECGGRGWDWVSGDGHVITQPPESGEDGIDYYQDTCPECLGAGGFIVITD